MRVVDDQVSTPNACTNIAQVTSEIIRHTSKLHGGCRNENSETYHLTAHGEASRWSWARKILELDPNRHEQITRELVPVPSDYFSSLAVRPRYSVLSQDKVEKDYKLDLAHWEDTLGELL